MITTFQQLGSSPAVEHVSYDHSTRILHLSFRGGRSYAFADIDPEVGEALRAEQSRHQIDERNVGLSHYPRLGDARSDGQE